MFVVNFTAQSSRGKGHQYTQSHGIEIDDPKKIGLVLMFLAHLFHTGDRGDLKTIIGAFMLLTAEYRAEVCEKASVTEWDVAKLGALPPERQIEIIKQLALRLEQRNVAPEVVATWFTEELQRPIPVNNFRAV